MLRTLSLVLITIAAANITLSARAQGGGDEALCLDYSTYHEYIPGEREKLAKKIASCTALLAGNSISLARRSQYLVRRCSFYLDANEESRGLTDCMDAIQLTPRSAEALLTRGLALAAIKQYDRALADLEKADAINSSASTLVALGWLFARQDQLDRALGYLDKAIAKESEKDGYTSARYLRGAVYLKRGDDRAIDDLIEAVKQDPLDAQSYRRLGYVYDKKEDTRTALQNFDRAIALDKTNAGAFRSRGILRFYGKSPELAVADFKESHGLNPKDMYVALWWEISSRRAGNGSILAGIKSDLDLSKWPGPLIELFLDRITPIDAVRAAKNADSKVENDQTCEANFFIAELSIEQKNLVRAKGLLNLAIEHCPKTFIEYRAAKAALRNLE